MQKNNNGNLFQLGDTTSSVWSSPGTPGPFSVVLVVGSVYSPSVQMASMLPGNWPLRCSQGKSLKKISILGTFSRGVCMHVYLTAFSQSDSLKATTCGPCRLVCGHTLCIFVCDSLLSLPFSHFPIANRVICKLIFHILVQNSLAYTFAYSQLAAG